MCGTWDVEMTFWFKPGARDLDDQDIDDHPAALRRTLHRRKIEGALNGTPVTTLAWTGFNTGTHQYEATRIATTNTARIAESRHATTTRPRQFELKAEYPLAGDTWHQRTVIQPTSADTMVATSYLSFGTVPEWKAVEISTRGGRCNTNPPSAVSRWWIRPCISQRGRGVWLRYLLEFAEPVALEDGRNYTARACAGEMPDGKWMGWLEFLPQGPGEPVRSARETTQPNRQDTEYWATGLTGVYLEGALRRALNRPVRPIARDVLPPVFDGPADHFVVEPRAAESILDPFSVYRKGEALLRRQLSALSGWHLVNIIEAYHMSREDPARLGAMEPVALVELIIAAVRAANAVPR